MVPPGRQGVARRRRAQSTPPQRGVAARAPNLAEPRWCMYLNRIADGVAAAGFVPVGEECLSATTWSRCCPATLQPCPTPSRTTMPSPLNARSPTPGATCALRCRASSARRLEPTSSMSIPRHRRVPRRGAPAADGAAPSPLPAVDSRRLVDGARLSSQARLGSRLPDRERLSHRRRNHAAMSSSSSRTRRLRARASSTSCTACRHRRGSPRWPDVRAGCTQCSCGMDRSSQSAACSSSGATAPGSVSKHLYRD